MHCWMSRLERWSQIVSSGTPGPMRLLTLATLHTEFAVTVITTTAIRSLAIRKSSNWPRVVKIDRRISAAAAVIRSMCWPVAVRREERGSRVPGSWPEERDPRYKRPKRELARIEGSQSRGPQGRIARRTTSLGWPGNVSGSHGWAGGSVQGKARWASLTGPLVQWPRPRQVKEYTWTDGWSVNQVVLNS